MPTTRTNYNEMLAEFRALAKRADQRLVRLEQRGQTNLSAYRSAAKTITARHGAGAVLRFNRGPSKDTRVLAGQINEVKHFLSMKESTRIGQREIWEKTAATLKDRYGLNTMSGGQIKQIFDGALWEKLNARFGSATAVKVLACIQKNDGQMKQVFADLAEKHVYLDTTDKRSINATVNNYMRNAKIGYLFED